MGTSQPLDRYVAHWKQRRAARLAANQRLAAKARADLSRVIHALADRYPIQRIILFGSLARGGFAPGSDIDLAVEGLPPGDYFTALAEANRLTRFWVDLKPLEELQPRFGSACWQEGKSSTKEPAAETDDCGSCWGG
jgi:predicted nucleotidyltransferase